MIPFLFFARFSSFYFYLVQTTTATILKIGAICLHRNRVSRNWVHWPEDGAKLASYPLGLDRFWVRIHTKFIFALFWDYTMCNWVQKNTNSFEWKYIAIPSHKGNKKSSKTSLLSSMVALAPVINPRTINLSDSHRGK